MWRITRASKIATAAVTASSTTTTTTGTTRNRIFGSVGIATAIVTVSLFTLSDNNPSYRSNNGGANGQKQSDYHNNNNNKGWILSPKIIYNDSPIIQNHDELDQDLTFTNWDQQEQTGLRKLPGLMIWGSNKNGIVDPTGKSPAVIQIPQRVQSFEGKVLKSLQLGEDVAAAVDANGDVYQWGSGYNSSPHSPEITLKNRDLVMVALNDQRLYCLSADGKHVFVMPKSRPAAGPTTGAIEFSPKKKSSSFWSYLGYKDTTTKKDFDPVPQLPIQELLLENEKVESIAGGKNHLLLLTNKGRVLCSEDGLSVSTVVSTGPGEFGKAKILEIACGEVHSLARDSLGRCWAWGINGFGQLAQGSYSHATLKLPQPTLVPSIQGVVDGEGIKGDEEVSQGCVKIAAGGNTSMFVIKDGNRGYVVKSAGMGVYGQLGDGSFTHIQGTPAKVNTISNLAEYNETHKRLEPIRIHSLSLGATHGFAVLDNATHPTGSPDTLYGRDVLSWGQNTYYQLLTGKRNNQPEPMHAVPLNSKILMPAHLAVAAVAKGRKVEETTQEEEGQPRNRLQLMPAAPRAVIEDRINGGKKKNKAEPKQEWVEEKIVAGHGVTAVFCAAV